MKRDSPGSLPRAGVRITSYGRILDGNIHTSGHRRGALGHTEHCFHPTRASKTCLAGALAQREAGKGRRVAYYKPLSANPGADPDLAFMAGILESLGSPQDAVPPPFPQPIDPHQLPTRLSEARIDQVAEAAAALEAAFDTLLVEWDAPAVPEGNPTVLIHPHTAVRMYSRSPTWWPVSGRGLADSPGAWLSTACCLTGAETWKKD